VTIVFIWRNRQTIKTTLCNCSVVDAEVLPPRFTQRLEPVTVVQGENTKLFAVVTGNHQPKEQHNELVNYHARLFINFRYFMFLKR